MLSSSLRQGLVVPPGQMSLCMDHVSVHEKAEGELHLGQNFDDGQRSETTLLDILLVMARGKWTLVKITAATALCSLLVSLLMPKWYSSSTLVLPPQKPQSIASLMVGQFGGLAALTGKDLGLKNPDDVYVAMLRSQTIADSLIRRFELQKVYRDKTLFDARKELAKHSVIDSTKEGLISVSVEDKDPKRAAEIANAYIDELYSLNIRLAMSEASQRRAFFETQLQKSKEELSDAEVNLKQTQSKTGLISLSDQARAIISLIAQLKAQITAKEIELQAASTFATDANPQVQVLEQQLRAMRDQLAKAEFDSSHEGDIQIATTKIPEAGLEYVRRVRDVKYYETLFEIVAKQYEAARLDEAKNAPIIQVVDAATVPEKKSRPSRALIVAISTLAMFFLGCLYLLFRESLYETSSRPHSRKKLQELRAALSR